ncbi:hypothetical protein GF389_01260 [Candidatus Dojkabacteria bacterium]|nr:hypothetical protein [Candidatus Dojkabacteria bacterium]
MKKITVKHIAIMSIGIIAIVGCSIVFSIIYSSTETNNSDPKEEQDNSIEHALLDFSNENDNATSTELTQALTQEYTSKELGIKLLYPDNWKPVVTETCYGKASHICLNISKDEHLFTILGFSGNQEDFEDLGDGYVDIDDYNNSYHYYVDGKSIMRYKYPNGLDEEGLVSSIVEFVTQASQDNNVENLGRTSFYAYDDGYIYEIVYSAPPGTIEINSDLNESEYIKTMDLILQSIKWLD